jgi:hypothetical protein
MLVLVRDRFGSYTIPWDTIDCLDTERAGPVGGGASV